MKKKLLYILLVFLLIINVVGCSSKDEESINNLEEEEKADLNKEPDIVQFNTQFGLLLFYVPKDEFQNRNDLNVKEDEIVFIKGDYDNNPENVISITVNKKNVKKEAKEYADNLNSKINNDIKYVAKQNYRIIEIYARENYVIDNNVNYEYIIDYNGVIYIVNINGPKKMQKEISKIASDVHSSLVFTKA